MMPDQKNLVISQSLHKLLKTVAKREGRVLQAFVEQLLSDALKNRKAAA